MRSLRRANVPDRPVSGEEAALRPPLSLGALRAPALLLLAVAGAAAACGEPAGARPERAATEESGPPPTPVRLAKVEVGTAPRIVRANGTVYPDEEVTVAAEVAGRITELGAEVGDRVAPESVLARVDDTDLVLERDQRALAVAESLARLGLESLPDGDVDLAKLPSVERARLEAENAKAKLERARTLHTRTPPLISDQDFADLETAWEVAESGQRAALLAARADLAQARTRRAQLAMSEQAVRDAVHRAPAPRGTSVWIVAARLVATGDHVAVGEPLFRLVDTDPLELRVRVPERRMAGLVAGRPATVRLASSPDPVLAKVTRVRPEVDPRTRTHDVEIEIPNADLRHAVGAFATAEVDVGEDAGVATIPARSLVTFAGVRKVFVVAEGKAADRLVVVGRALGDRVEIVSGLRPGESFVADPPPGLVAGTAVRVESSDPRAAAPPPPGGGGK